MNTLLQANIFFFVTTIAVVAFLIFGSIALVYLIRILRNIAQATDNLDKRIDAASAEMEHLRRTVTESFIFNLIFKKKRKAKQ